MRRSRDPAPAESRGLCAGCQHYFVTWDPRRPHGCRVLAFKSREAPSWIVFRSSGFHCQLHRPRVAPAARGSDGA